MPIPSLLNSRAFLGAGLLVASLLAIAPLRAQNAADKLDKSAIESIVKDYLLKNPEIIQEAMVELQRVFVMNRD